MLQCSRVSPPSLGPGQYDVPQLFDQIVKEFAAPFNLSDNRFKYNASSDTPSGADYFPRFRKNRILNGTSLRYTAPRICEIKRKASESFSIRRRAVITRKQGVGKLHVGKPLRGVHDEGLSVPPTGFRGFRLIDGRWRRDDLSTDSVLSSTLSQVKTSSTIDADKGTAWSQRTEVRFRDKRHETPGPGEYDLTFPAAEAQACARTGRQLRYVELLQHHCLKEDLPGPASYLPPTPKSKTGKHGTFSLSKRQDIFDSKDGPSPVTYNDTRTAFELINKHTSLKGSPFLTDTERFTKYIDTTPGPSYYNVKGGLYYELKRNNVRKFSVRQTAFLTSVVCDDKDNKLPLPEVPDPGHYNIEEIQGSCKIEKPTFGKCPRFKKIVSDAPDCTQYDIHRGFNYIKNQLSHLRSSPCAFLTCSKRELPKRPFLKPGPADYNICTSSLNTKGGLMLTPLQQSVVSDNPSPAHYFQRKKIVSERKHKTSKTSPKKKVLRTFTGDKYATGHCDL